MFRFQSAVQTILRRGFRVFVNAVFYDLFSKSQKTLLGKRFIQRKVNDYKMFLDLEDRGISRSLILFGTREVDHKIILEKVLCREMRVFDIGANIGYYVLMEKKLIGEEGHILAIEPSPTNVRLLQRNLDLNQCSDSTITVLEGGVSNQSGVLNFHLAQQSNLHTFHPKGSAARNLTGEVLEVKTYSVPELVKKYGAPDLIRMDVEGHEVEIISGMLEDVERGKYKPMICFEPHISCYNENHDFVPVLQRLFAAGYSVSYLSSNAQSGTERIEDMGYEPFCLIPSDGEVKAIFENVLSKDAIKILTEIGGARTVLFSASG